MAKNKSRWVPVHLYDVVRKIHSDEPVSPLVAEIYKMWRALPLHDRYALKPYICDGNVIFTEPRKDYYLKLTRIE